MSNYDFRTLSPIDFEGLVRDLLQNELGMMLESFKSGKDQGIDFRSCRDSSNTIIVQSKHYVESGFNKLQRDLQALELPKVKSLSPKRYILATSLGLSPPQKGAIAAIFVPFMQGTFDCLGKQDLNNLLAKFPDVERHTLKLWLFSLPLLQEVLHSAIKNLAAFELEKIRERAKLYVQNESFEQAVDILDRHNFCVIAGPPGIGKTTLAEMLVLHYSRAGYEIVKVSQDIDEAWSLKTRDSKQVFYYDDFLGQTSASEKLLKNEDQRLLDFVGAVRKSSGLKLILTTREYILKQAYQQYESLERYGLDSQKCIVDLEKYNRLNRAQILYNHLYFSSLPKPFFEDIVRDSHYLQIIDHPNYNPRIVQFMTDQAFLSDVDPSHYTQNFLANLKNPLRVWEHAFSNHLSQRARNVLIVMASLPERVFLEDLQNAFESYNSSFSNLYRTGTGPQDFRKSLKELEGDFLSSQADSGSIIVGYKNHSARDYIEQYLRQSDAEVEILVSSAVFFEQLRVLWEGPYCALSKEKLRKLNRDDRQMFTALIGSCIGAPTCLLANFERGKSVTVERWAPSLETKALVLVGMYLEGFEEIDELLYRVVHGVLALIERGNSDRYRLAPLIESLRSSTHASEHPFSRLIEKGKQALISKAYFAYQFRPLCDLLDRMPDLFSQEDKRTAQAALRETADEISAGDFGDDPERMREEAEEFRAVSTRLGIDLSKEVGRIESMADQRESRSGRANASIDYRKSDGLGGQGSNDEIVSLFSTLSGETEKDSE